MSRDWRDHAECRDVDPRVFVSSRNGDNMIEAKRLCTSCPVRQECLDDAVAARDWYGYRGGMSGEDRRRLMTRPLKPDLTPEVIRLHLRRWKPQAIGLRVGLEIAVVYRILKEFRESGEAA